MKFHNFYSNRFVVELLSEENLKKIKVFFSILYAINIFFSRYAHLMNWQRHETFAIQLFELLLFFLSIKWKFAHSSRWKGGMRKIIDNYVKTCVQILIMHKIKSQKFTNLENWICFLKHQWIVNGARLKS